MKILKLKPNLMEQFVAADEKRQPSQDRTKQEKPSRLHNANKEVIITLCLHQPKQAIHHSYQL
jgi:hypothetical protein